MKKRLFTAAMIVTMGLAVVGCGATGVSGDVTATTMEEEMDMTVPQQITEELPEVEVTTVAVEESTEAAAEATIAVDETAAEMTTAAVEEGTTSGEAATDEAATGAEATTEETSETEAE